MYFVYNDNSAALDNEIPKTINFSKFCKSDSLKDLNSTKNTEAILDNQPSKDFFYTTNDVKRNVIEELKMSHGFFDAKKKVANLNKHWKIYEQFMLSITEEIFNVRHFETNNPLYKKFQKYEYEIIYNLKDHFYEKSLAIIENLEAKLSSYNHLLFPNEFVLFIKYQIGLTLFRSKNLKSAEKILTQNYIEFKDQLEAEENDTTKLKNNTILSGLVSGVTISMIFEINGFTDDSLKILHDINDYLNKILQALIEKTPTRDIYDRMSFVTKLSQAKFNKRIGNDDLYLAHLKSYIETDKMDLNNMKHYKLGVEYFKNQDLKKAAKHFEQVKFDGKESNPLVTKSLRILAEIYETWGKPAKASLMIDILEKQSNVPQPDKSDFYIKKAGLLQKLGQKTEARDIYLKHLQLEDAINSGVSENTIKECRLLSNQAHRNFKKKSYFEAILSYEKVLHKVDQFVNSDTYLKFLTIKFHYQKFEISFNFF